MINEDHGTRQNTTPATEASVDHDRRQLLATFGAVAGSTAAGLMPESAQAQSDNIAAPRRALTGRDASGKSVFKSFDVTPQVVRFESRPGLAFYELYVTDGIPKLSGLEQDPMLTRKGSFPEPGASLFRLVMFPPKPPEGTRPDPAAYGKYLAELDQKIPGMASHFEPDTPGMHTSDSVDYGIVIRGEMTLELDDGKTIHLRQGDCVVQNGTRHRWRNPLTEPCLMAFILIGGKRESTS